MSIKVKICGITTISDAEMILPFRPNFFGFILYKESPRYIPPDRARDIIDQIHSRVRAVGVFVNKEAEDVLHYARLCRFDFVQLHGNESSEDIDFLMQEGIKVIKAFRFKDKSTIKEAKNCPARFILFDAFKKGQYGGTGEAINTDLLDLLQKDKALSKKKIFISGGLHADNVGQVLSRITPFAIDACSQLESAPGLKDSQKAWAFIEKVRELSPKLF